MYCFFTFAQSHLSKKRTWPAELQSSAGHILSFKRRLYGPKTVRRPFSLQLLLKEAQVSVGAGDFGKLMIAQFFIEAGRLKPEGIEGDAARSMLPRGALNLLQQRPAYTGSQSTSTMT